MPSTRPAAQTQKRKKDGGRSISLLSSLAPGCSIGQGHSLACLYLQVVASLNSWSMPELCGVKDRSAYVCNFTAKFEDCLSLGHFESQERSCKHSEPFTFNSGK